MCGILWRLQLELIFSPHTLNLLVRNCDLQVITQSENPPESFKDATEKMESFMEQYMLKKLGKILVSIHRIS
jgi:hypothetical protein